MPKLPGYNQRTNAPDPVGVPKYTADQFGGGGAASAAGTAINDALENYQKVQKQQEDLWLEKTTAEKQNYWMAELDRRKQSADPGAPNFTPTILNDYDEDMQKAIDEASTPRLKAELTNKSLKIRGALQNDSMTFEAASMQEKQKLDVGAVVDLNANTLLSKPTQFNDIAANTLSAIENSGLTPIAKEQAKVSAKNTLALSAVQGTIQINPWAAKKQLESGQWDTYLDPRLKIGLVNSTDNEIDRRKREAEANARDNFKKTFLSQNKFTTPEQDSAALLAVEAEGNDELYGFATRVIAEKQKALANDPASYVMGSPNVNLAVQDYQAAAKFASETNDPTLAQDANGKRERMYQTMMSEQSRLGVTVPKIVTGQFANQIKQIVQNPNANADDLIRAVATVEQQYGTMAPRAFAELTKEGVPEYINILGSMDMPNQTQARESLARAIRKGPTELAKAVPTADVSLINKSIDEEMGAITKAFGSRQGGDQIVANIRSSARLLGLQYAAEGRNDTDRYGNRAIDDYGRAALNDIVNSKYNFASTYAVPVVAGNIAIDPEDIQTQLYSVKQSVGARDLMVPRDAPAGVGKDGYRDAVLNHGYWVNNPAGDGLILYDMTGKPVVDEGLARIDQNGRLLNMDQATIQVKFDDLQVQANKEKVAAPLVREFSALNGSYWAPTQAQYQAASPELKQAYKARIQKQVDDFAKRSPEERAKLEDAAKIQNRKSMEEYEIVKNDNRGPLSSYSRMNRTSVYLQMPDWVK